MEKSFSLLLFLLLVFSFPFARGKDIICVICETTTSLAEEYIAIEGLNETEVLNQLDKFCNVLPASWQTTCIFFLNTYGRQIVDELIDGTPAEKICSQFSLCDSVKKMTATKLRSNVPCPLCELLTVIIEEYIDESGFNETQILKDLAEFCGYLPKDVRPKCSIFVESAASKLVHFIFWSWIECYEAILILFDKLLLFFRQSFNIIEIINALIWTVLHNHGGQLWIKSGKLGISSDISVVYVNLITPAQITNTCVVSGSPRILRIKEQRRRHNSK